MAVTHAGPAWMVIQADTSAELTAAKNAGATHGLVEAQWSGLQSVSGGAVNAATVTANTDRVIAAGLKVCLRVSPQYIPTFVDTAGVKFRRNGSVDWNPGSNTNGDNVRDWVWSASTRALLQDFLQKLFAQLDWSKIERVQLGGLMFGELSYPTTDGTQWWGFSAPAQTGTDLAAGQTVCPVPGYVPSTGTTWVANDVSFHDWYRNSLINFMTWLIAQHRAYFAGPIYVMHPGAGLRAVSQTPTSSSQALNFRKNAAAGLHWVEQLTAYPDAQVYPYCTWADSVHFWPPDPFSDANDGNAAPWYHLLRVARATGRAGRIWGENTGGQTNADMDRVFSDGAVAHGYQGLTWMSADTLIAGGTAATYANLTSRIRTANAAFGGGLYGRGVNMAGAEFAAAPSTLPGTYSVDYAYDSAPAFTGVAARGHKLVRIPFRWERIQPALGAALNATELGRLTTAVSTAAAAGMKCVLDVHNYARYINSTANGGATLVAGSTLAAGDFVDLWTRLSAAFKGNAGVYAYGLMNEPHDLTGTTGGFTGTTRYDWASGVQGWTGDGGSVSNVGGQLRFVLAPGTTGAYYQTRKDDAGTDRNGPVTGDVLEATVTLAAGTPGTWRTLLQWLNSSFQWQNGSTTYTRTDTGASVGNLVAGVAVRVRTTFATTIPAGSNFAIQIEANDPTAGTYSADVDDFAQGAAAGGTSGAQTWESFSQQAVTAIRASGDTTKILVAGYGWSGAQAWTNNHPDPWITNGGDVAYEAHYYFDVDNSGDYPATYATENASAVSHGYASLASRVAHELSPYLTWLVKYGVRGFIGETGWTHNESTTSWNAVGEAVYAELDRYGVDVTYWSAGARWGSGYNLSVYTGSTQATLQAQSSVIEAHPSTLTFAAPPSAPPPGGPSASARRRMQVSDIPTLRGVNWYGMEDGLRGPTLTELQNFVSLGFNFVRLPTRYDTTNAAIATVLADAETAGIWLGVQVHNYGRIGGTASINATDGTVITSANQQTWFDKCTNQLGAFSSYVSYVPLDMNEPKQTGTEWEPISRGRVAALRAAGWSGPIGVSAARLSSAGGINNSDAHPGGWWITDSGAFLEVHQYLQGLTDSYRQTSADLNSWVVNSSGQSDLTTYVQYINRAFGWGALGDSRWTFVPMLIGEFAMPPGCETELEAFLVKVDARKVGAVQWAGGMWPDSYAWKISSAQLTVLSSHTVAAAPISALSDTFDSLDSSRWSSSGSPAPVIASGRLSCAVSSSYPTITSIARYNLTASEFFVELVQPSTTAATAQVVFMLTTPAVSKAGLEFVLDAATTLRARRWVSNTATELNNVTYSSTNHRWLRIAEAGGTVSFQTSPDAVAWSTLATIPTATLTGLGIDVTQLKVSLGAGYYGTESTPGTALFDNLNAAPAAPPPPPPPPPAPAGGRQNLAPNPALKNNATGWAAVDATTGAALSGWARSTSVGAVLPRTTGFEGTTVPLDILPPRAQVVAGQQYYWAVWIHALTAVSGANMLVNYYAAASGGTFVSNSGATVPLVMAAGDTTRFVLGPYTVPAGAVSGYLKLNDLNGSCEVTGYQVELASTFGAYFDGDSPGASWDSADGNSTSTIRQIGGAAGDPIVIGESFTKTITASGPTFADAFGIGATFTVAAGTPSSGVRDAALVRDGFLISSLEWDQGKGRNRVSAFTFGISVTTARVSRRRVRGGSWELVRGGSIDVVNGRMVRPADDYEFPSGTDLDYRIEGITSTGTVLQTATVRRLSVADQVWLKFVTRPALNQRLTYMGRTEIARQSRTAVYDVQGRPDPVVVSDVHGSRRFSIKCKAETPAEAATLDHALSQGLPCYLQVPETINAPSIYAVIGDYRSDAPALKSMRSVFTIPLIEVAAPPPSIVSPGATWAQILNDYPTWEALVAAVPTWLDIAD